MQKDKRYLHFMIMRVKMIKAWERCDCESWMTQKHTHTHNLHFTFLNALMNNKASIHLAIEDCKHENNQGTQLPYKKKMRLRVTQTVTMKRTTVADSNRDLTERKVLPCTSGLNPHNLCTKLLAVSSKEEGDCCSFGENVQQGIN